ncbi:MAG: DNA polymerase III subunit chi [Gammaproteobacteria bacterium]|nr:DNA polymerase III subunit chi [Gammaproteobacteria bacterium]
MLRIDFHILNHSKNDAFHYLAKLVEKVFLLKKPIFVFTSSFNESKVIDDLLWSFRANSFVPHHIVEDMGEEAPILISHTKIPRVKEVLINLTPSIPEFYGQFSRIIEMVYNDEQIKQANRLKYREYQKLECELHTFRS